MIWQTRTLATFTAATAMTDGENPLIEEAQRIGTTGSDADREEPATKATAEPNTGSYERFLLTFGNRARWAGAH